MKIQTEKSKVIAKFWSLRKGSWLKPLMIAPKKKGEAEPFMVFLIQGVGLTYERALESGCVLNQEKESKDSIVYIGVEK